jgi:hypothetical protein
MVAPNNKDERKLRFQVLEFLETREELGWAALGQVTCDG